MVQEKSKFFLEIYTEELPSFAQNKDIYKEFFFNLLNNSHIDFNNKLEIYTTLYRVVLYLPEVSDITISNKKSIRGPMVIQKDAVKRFCMKYNITEDKLDVQNGYVFYHYLEDSINAQESLKIMLQTQLHKMPFLKKMIWNESMVEWVRPIRSIVALYNKEIVEFEFAGLKSGNKISLNKYLSDGKMVSINSFEDYKKVLKKNYVILEENIRIQSIVESVEKIVKDLYFAIGEDVILEFAKGVAHLSEYAHLSYSNIDIEDFNIDNILWKKIYLKVFKDEILLSCHSAFIFSSNVPININMQKDYLNLVKARLMDALFLFNLDQKANLDDLYNRLKNIKFYNNKLKGNIDNSILNQSLRMQKIASFVFGDQLASAAKMYLVGMTSALYNDYNDLLAYLSYNLTQNKSILLDEIKFIYNIDTLVNLYFSGERVTPSRDIYGMRKLSNEIIDFALKHDINLYNIIEYIEDLIGGENIDDIIAFLFVRLKSKIDNYNENIFANLSSLKEYKNLNHFVTNYQNVFHLYTNNNNIFNILYRLEKLVMVNRVDVSQEINNNLLKDNLEIMVFMGLGNLSFKDLCPLIDNLLNNCQIHHEDIQIRNNRELLISLAYQKGLKELGLKKSIV